VAVPEPDELSVALVDAINDVGGRHEGHRAVHAKGILCAGEFTPTEAAAELCAAEHLQPGAAPVRAHVRFSNGGSKPDGHDAGPDGRGMAVKLYLGDGSTTDIVALTLPVFFVRTRQDFLEFTRVRKPNPDTGQPDVAKLGAWVGEHPEAQAALQAAISAPAPESYARLRYHAIHAFRWTAPDGTERFVRYRWEPEAGEGHLEAEEAQAREPDYLQADLRERLASGPVAFTLHVTLAGEGDDPDDPTVAWPEERESVEAGRLEVREEAFDRDTGDDVLVFDPTRVTTGIGLSGDQILIARRGAYSVSVERRTAVR
jgi:catalase